MPSIEQEQESFQRALKHVLHAEPSVIRTAFENDESLRDEVGADVLRGPLLYVHGLRHLRDATVTSPVFVDPATARSVQATENVWRRIGEEFGLYSSVRVSELLGSRSANRTIASDMRARGELLGVKRRNAYVYPGFQFDGRTGDVLPWVARLIALGRESDRNSADVIMWMMSPTTYFEGDRPVDHVAKTDRLLDVAERAWSIQW